MKKLIRVNSLSEQVSDAIFEEIVSGRFALGQMLSESMIAERLGVSRTPVREAFSHLEQKGLVQTIPKKGTFIFNPSNEEVKDLFEVSSCIELKGLKLSFERNNHALAAKCESILQDMEKEISEKKEPEYQQSNAKLHHALVAFSGNQLLIELYDEVSTKLKALAAASIYIEKFCAYTHECHQCIVRSIINSDENKAIECFEAHIKHS